MPELELKERLAQELFLNMMKEAGKQISRIDYSNQIQKIIEDKTDLNIKNVIKDINFHKHDFLLQSRNGILLVNLYYLENGIKSLELEKGIGNAILIIVTNKEPFFEIAYVNEFMENKSLRPLDNNEIIKLDKSIIEKYKYLIKKRFSYS